MTSDSTAEEYSGSGTDWTLHSNPAKTLEVTMVCIRDIARRDPYLVYSVSKTSVVSFGMTDVRAEMARAYNAWRKRQLINDQ